MWENSECAKNYANLNRVVTDTMLCAGGQGKNGCLGKQMKKYSHNLQFTSSHAQLRKSYLDNMYS